MRILQHGNINQYKTQRPVQFKCGCGCIWIAFDGEYRSYDFPWEGIDMDCPTCGKTVVGKLYEERIDI